MGSFRAVSTTFDRLCRVMRDVFEDDALQITPATSAADVEQWDSLLHVTLVVMVEREFGVRFSSSEVAKLENVGDLVALIDARTSR
jgi:acyl carrier protein